MDIIKKMECILEDSKNSSYIVKDIPVQLLEIDKIINEILDFCKGLSQGEQDLIYKSVTVEMAWLLICFGIRMATYSLRLSNQRYFTNGLFAISMTLGIVDRRDILLILPLYYDVQKKNGLSFNDILKQNNAFISILKDFLNRDEKDKSLECMGYVLGIDENNNPIYQRTW